ncbi:MAG: chemotaxis protein CheW [Litorilituus sp.]|jgi:purine-binding chemotaxis protein CheW|nr:chemotaxis protein CheW [Litorilituus sp.]
MAKPLAASKKVMKNYLSELLTEELPELEKQPENLKKKSNEIIENKRLETLLKNVNVEIDVAVEPLHSPNCDTKHESKRTLIKSKKEFVEKKEVELTADKTNDDFIAKTPKSYRQGDFQALFFDVAGLTIAVPLIELGGIHKVEKSTPLMGKPDWFKGVMLYRDEKVNVVDTALWVMPEKCDEKLKNSLNYQYIIMLSDSSWGLMAENLVDTVVLKQNDVKWLDTSIKRPWLAGLVKDKMCALLNVEALIQLLNEGSAIN